MSNNSHINGVVGHFKGKVAAWDVVNEAFADGPSGELRPDSPFHVLGPTFIDDAFTCFTSAYPPESNPLCQQTLATTLPGFIDDRSAYYQATFFAHAAADPAYRTPVFNAGTLTD